MSCGCLLWSQRAVESGSLAKWANGVSTSINYHFKWSAQSQVKERRPYSSSSVSLPLPFIQSHLIVFVPELAWSVVTRGTSTRTFSSLRPECLRRDARRGFGFCCSPGVESFTVVTLECWMEEFFYSYNNNIIFFAPRLSSSSGVVALLQFIDGPIRTIELNDSIDSYE